MAVVLFKRHRNYWRMYFGITDHCAALGILENGVVGGISELLKFSSDPNACGI